MRPGNCFSYFTLFYPFGSIWKHLEAFGSIWKLTVFAVLHCLDTEKTKKRNQRASKFFQNSDNSFLVSIILSYTHTQPLVLLTRGKLISAPINNQHVGCLVHCTPNQQSTRGLPRSLHTQSTINTWVASFIAHHPLSVVLVRRYVAGV